MTNNKEKRHQVEERELFTDVERERIAKKSDHKCVWCGKEVYFGYGATIDHFIPLKKGGTNDPQNLTMMCTDCNQKKGSKIFPWNIVAKYLKPEYQKELGDYFDEYTKKYDYVSRGNLMECDAYELTLIPGQIMSSIRKRKKHPSKSSERLIDNLYNRSSNIMLVRAYPDDEDRLVEYYSKYLKKYGYLTSEEAARNNIKFWMRFGVIYYVERPDGIAVMTTVLVNKHGFISINLFPYYATPPTYALAKGSVSCLTDAILYENNLEFIPLSLNMLEADKLAPRILRAYCIKRVDNRMLCACYGAVESYNPKIAYALEKADLDKFNEFMKFFQDVENEVHIYLYENNLLDYSWMADEILERDFDITCFCTPR